MPLICVLLYMCTCTCVHVCVCVHVRVLCVLYVVNVETQMFDRHNDFFAAKYHHFVSYMYTPPFSLTT